MNVRGTLVPQMAALQWRNRGVRWEAEPPHAPEVDVPLAEAEKYAFDTGALRWVRL